MKKLVSFPLLAAFFLLQTSFVAIHSYEDDCSIVHSGTFQYDGTEGKVKVVIDGNKHTEYHSGGKYVIESRLVWENSCEYTATLRKATVPDFPYKKGTTMNVKITKIKGNEIFLSCRIGDQTFKSTLTKVE